MPFNTEEAEGEVSLQVQNQPDLKSEFKVILKCIEKLLSPEKVNK